jgi:plastocyanin
MRRLLVSLVLTAAILALPVASYAASPVPVNLAGFLFNNKKNDKITIKLGGSVRFTWKNGVHNVLTSKTPAGGNKVNSGSPAAGHKPITFKPSKKGTYVFYCVPHKALGMVLTLTVK